MQERILLKYQIIQLLNFNSIVAIMKRKAKRKVHILMQYNSSSQKQKDRPIQVTRKDH